jgi:phage terminase large subunit-like protein
MYDPYPLDYPILDELVGYSEAVLEGRIVACQKHKWACQRFLRDLGKQGTDDFPYIFNEVKALHFLNWMMLFKHTKGPLAGTRKIPEPIEKFVFGNIYGWVYADTGYRRFRQAYWQVGRKNAKSQDLAIVGLYEMSAMGEPSAEVYVAATKRDQTKYVWEEADAIYRRCEDLADKFKTSYGVIRHLKSNSTFSRLSQEDRKKGDGGNPQCGILDEYHAHETDEYYDLLTSGMKNRVQPLLIIITTAGFDLSNPCYRDEYDYISKILNPDIPIENDRYFAMVNELDKDKEGNLIDDIRDESCWLKANPILAKTQEGLTAIRAELQVALDKPAKMRDFLTKTMNVWVNQREQGYMDMTKWKLCGRDDFDYSILEGKECIVGVDLAAKIDLCSVAFEFKTDDKYVILGHSFMPEDTLQRKMRTDKVPYDLWAKQRWITATPGAVVDYDFIKAHIKEFENEHNCTVKELCCDPWNATQFMNDMTDEGYVAVEIRQGVKTLGGPTKDFRDQVYSGNVLHDNNPVLTWAISNAVTKMDPNENIMLDKAKSTERIDPIASVINAHVRAMVMDVQNGIDINRYADPDFLDKLWR